MTKLLNMSDFNPIQIIKLNDYDRLKAYIDKVQDKGMLARATYAIILNR